MPQDNAQTTAPDPTAITGKITFPDSWTVFAPFASNSEVPDTAALKRVPDTLTLDGKTVSGERITPTRNQYDFQTHFGAPPYEQSHAAYVFLPIESATEQEVTLGFGADWFMQVWLDGDTILDTTAKGNGTAPPSISDHRVNVTLTPGEHVVAVRFMNGLTSAVLAIGGPAALRAGDFETIRPDLFKKDSANIWEKYPADPEAPLQWRVPEGFDPDTPGLGLTQLDAAEHISLLHCHKSDAPMDEGGSGEYQSLKEGTWNHNVRAAVYQDRLIAIWDNHALDENGPGSRVVARVGKVLNDRGDIDWGSDDDLIELAPAPVPVRRRKLHSDEDKIRSGQAHGSFHEIDGRLFFCGHLGALHGLTTGLPQHKRFFAFDETVPSENFCFVKSPGALSSNYAVWELGVRFFQEWAVRDDRLQPISPLYKENELPAERQITPDLSLPLEPLTATYANAPLLAEAPADFQKCVLHGERQPFMRIPKRPEGYGAADGHNGVAHGHATEYQRADGGWVAVIENKRPKQQPFYYAAAKPSVDEDYPPARRTNLYGSVKPCAGELPDGSNYIVCNSSNRQNMYIVVSSDGRVFDRTWLLMFKQLSDFTPGAMKNEGGPGSGAQYFRAATIGQSLWIIYSISKEHMGATRVPVEALK